MHLVMISHDLPIRHRHSQGTVLLHVQGSALLSKLRIPAWDDRATRRDASARVQIAIPIEIAIPLELAVELTFELCHKLSLVMPPRVLVHEFEPFIRDCAC